MSKQFLLQLSNVGLTDPLSKSQLLKWKPKYTFEIMIDEMVEYWSNKL